MVAQLDSRPLQRGPKGGGVPGAAALRILLALLLLPLLASPALAAMPVRAALMMHLNTGRVLYQKNADSPIAPASLTKIMTSFLVHDALASGRLSLGSRERIGARVARVGGSTMHLRAGESVSVEQLLQGMIVASGNDAATALAIRTAGSEAAFVRAMNEKARSVGMRLTSFKNPTGLPAPGQRTTARDLMRLCVAYLSRHPGAIRFHSQKSLVHGRHTLGTTNPFLGSRGVDGLKTGYTGASGYNIILTTTRAKTRLLIIVLGGQTKARREVAAANLLEAGLRNPANPKLVTEILDGPQGRRLARGHKAKAAKAEARAKAKKRKAKHSKAGERPARTTRAKKGTEA